MSVKHDDLEDQDLTGLYCPARDRPAGFDILAGRLPGEDVGFDESHCVSTVFRATGIRLAELAGLRYDPGDPRRSDIDLWQREITVRGKDRIVRIGHQAARSLDRYIRARSRHEQAWRPQLWLGAGNREPLTAAGSCQLIARRGRQCGVDAYPHRFRHDFSHTWLDRGGPEGDLM